VPSDVFRADLPAAIVALIPLILIVSAVDAGAAREWADRHREELDGEDSRRWALFRSIGIAWVMLATGFAALVLALLELRWRTNRFD
jgi:hypothetical protein